MEAKWKAYCVYEQFLWNESHLIENETIRKYPGTQIFIEVAFPVSWKGSAERRLIWTALEEESKQSRQHEHVLKETKNRGFERLEEETGKRRGRTNLTERCAVDFSLVGFDRVRLFRAYFLKPFGSFFGIFWFRGEVIIFLLYFLGLSATWYCKKSSRSHLEVSSIIGSNSHGGVGSGRLVSSSSLVLEQLFASGSLFPLLLLPVSAVSPPLVLYPPSPHSRSPQIRGKSKYRAISHVLSTFCLKEGEEKKGPRGQGAQPREDRL